MRFWSLLLLLLWAALPLRAEDLVTREYVLKNVDSPAMIRAINIVVEDPTKKRLMSGQGKRLVVTDTPDRQNAILELLPIMDVTMKATTETRMVMSMVARSNRYFRSKNKSSKGAARETTAAAPADLWSSSVKTYDAYKSTRSVYSEEDAKLVAKRRIIEEEGRLPALSDLVLKGIFKTATGPSMGILAYGNILFTARDGGLFERNRTRVKNVTSEVQKDRVILIGPDKRPREFKFKSTL